MAIGSLASTSLAGCSRTIERRQAEIVAVPVKTTPPVDLLICPIPAQPFPTDAAATIPPSIRNALKGLASDYRLLLDRHRRLVGWHRAEPCA